MATITYFLDQDGDGHWYMIRTEWREEWNKLRDVEDAWDTDEWAKFEDCRLGGGIQHIDFIPINESGE